MQLTQEVIDYIEKRPWDEDYKQDVYVRLLEYETPIKDPFAFIETTYKNVVTDEYRHAAVRKELEQEMSERLKELVGQDDSSDPREYLEAETILKTAGKLSDVLARTLDHILEGWTPAEMAVEDGVEVNVIYQRIWQLKQWLKGAVNGK